MAVPAPDNNLDVSSFYELLKYEFAGLAIAAGSGWAGEC